MISRLFIAAPFFFLCTLSYGQESGPTVAELAKSARSLFAEQCTTQKAIQDRQKSPEDKAAFQTAVDLACTCMPKETDLLEARLTPSQTVPLAEFAGHLRTSLHHCAGEAMRRFVLRQCRTDEREGVPAAQREEFCRCMETGINALPDQTIAMAAQEAEAHFRAKVAARREGKPDPAPHDDAITTLSAQCKARL